MNWTGYKLEISIAGVTGLMILLFSLMSHLIKGGRGVQQEELLFEMARPKASFAPEFDLSNREILRNLVKSLAKTTQNSPVVGKGGIQTPPPAAAKTANKKTATAKPLKKRAEMTVAVVDGDPARENPDSETFADAEDFDYRPREQKAAPLGNDGTKKKPIKKNAQNADKEWKKLFMTTPSEKLMVEFVHAYQAKEVTDNLYYEVLSDLIMSQNEGNQRLGVYGMTSVSSLRGFSEAAHWSFRPEVQKRATLDDSIQSYLLSYNQTGKLAFLDAGLKSKEPEVVLRSTQVISEGFARVRAGESFGTGRDQRNPTVTSTLTSYGRFIPTLQGLRGSADPAIASAAETLITQIQSMSIAGN